MRAVVDRLSVDEEARRIGLPLSALRPVLGPDKANARRTVRSLLRRGDADWIVDEAGTRRLKLNWLVCVSALIKREGWGDDDPFEAAREHRRQVEAALADILAEEQEKRRALSARESLWEEPVRPPSRRPPGPNQTRIIAVLVRYADDPQMGLPVAAVRRIAREGSPGDKANVLRAIRSLVRSGTLQLTRDAQRLRLATWESAWWRWRATPYTLDPPLADEKAEAVLEAFGEPGGVSRKGGSPWLAERFPEPG